MEAEIRRVNSEEVGAFLRNDTSALRRLWSDELRVTNPLNQLVGKEQVLELMASGVLAFTSYAREIEYLRIYGDTAVVAGSERVVWAGRMPTAGKLSHLRFTGVWVREGGEWREVVRHANITAVE